MKIAVITKRVSESMGGAERVSVNLCRKLAESGHDVHIFAGGADTVPDGVHLHHIKVSTWLSPVRLLSFQRKIRRGIQAERFDLVYSLCQVFPVDIYRVGDGVHRHWMRLQYPRSMLRWTKYLTSLVHLAMVWLEGQIMNKENCRYFVTNSELVKNQLVDYFSVPGEQIEVIYNGVEQDRFNPEVGKYREEMRTRYMIGDTELVLLFVSNNWERKGLATVIDAIAKTEARDARLVIVGRGKKSSYIDLARSKGIRPDRLIFTGRSSEVWKFYGMSDIFILPSRYEPFANVCLEAMACGLPVITTKDNGASELISQGEDGFVLDDWKDADGLAECIMKLQNSAERKKIGSEAALKAQKYTWERHAEETDRFFDRVMSGR